MRFISTISASLCVLASTTSANILYNEQTNDRAQVELPSNVQQYMNKYMKAYAQDKSIYINDYTQVESNKHTVYHLLNEINPLTNQSIIPPISTTNISISDIEIYGPVVAAVQSSGVTGNDSKSFVDYPLTTSPLSAWEYFFNLSNVTDTSMHNFINTHFTPAGSDITTDYVPSDYSQSPAFLELVHDPILKKFSEAVNELWSVLAFTIDEDVYTHPEQHTLLPLLHNHMFVPGGRFREIYYWDSYWIVLGLLTCDMTSTAQDLVENLLNLCDRYGFIPNGSREYYLNRSQPPYAVAMVDAVYQKTGNDTWLQQWLPTLDKEYQFWQQQDKHSVTLPKLSDNQTTIYNLNRYYTDIDYPRPESFTADNATAFRYAANHSLYIPQTHCMNHNASTDANCTTALFSETGESSLLSNIAASAESGQDFSSRWFADGINLYSDITTQIIPVDLNSILAYNERTLAGWHGIFNETSYVQNYTAHYVARLDAIKLYLYHNDTYQWRDYNFITNQTTNSSENLLVNYHPLWSKAYDPCSTDEPAIIKSLNESGLILQGALVTSLVNSTQQWDFPNAWAPLQHLIITGIQTSQQVINRTDNDTCSFVPYLEGQQLAYSLASRWVYSTYLSYNNSGFIDEKLIATQIGNGTGGGGEYNPQVGFGWSNGVALVFINEYANQLNFSRDINMTAYELQQNDANGTLYDVLIPNQVMHPSPNLTYYSGSTLKSGQNFGSYSAASTSSSTSTLSGLLGVRSVANSTNTTITNSTST